jgi:hypothetical protein
MVGSYVEPDKSRNYFFDTKTDPNKKIMTINELNPSEEAKGLKSVYQSVNLHTCDYVQFDLSNPLRMKSKQSPQTPFSKTTGASNNATEDNRIKRVSANTVQNNYTVSNKYNI